MLPWDCCVDNEYVEGNERRPRNDSTSSYPLIDARLAVAPLGINAFSLSHSSLVFFRDTTQRTPILAWKKKRPE